MRIWIKIRTLRGIKGRIRIKMRRNKNERNMKKEKKCGERKDEQEGE